MSKEKKGKTKDDERLNLIKERLTCSVLKTNYIDDPTVLLGYPIVHSKSKYGINKIELYPIPEMLSYEGYLNEIDNQQQKLDLYFDVQFRTSGNEMYNCWMPVYINKEHYEKNKTHVLNSFSIIKYGPEGKKEYDFKPEQIFEILPIVLNKMIIGMFQGKSEISSSFIISYFQYVLLFKKLCHEFEDENLGYLNSQLGLIHKNGYKIDKKIIPDIGDFLMILFYCNKDTHEEEMKKMWDCIFDEHIIRGMFWAFHSDENKQKMKDMVLNPLINEICLRRYETEPDFKMKGLIQFNNDLNNLKLFDQIVDIISKDEKYLESVLIGKDNVREHVSNNMGKYFKRLYCACGEDSKKEIKKIIIDNLNFIEYFGDIDDIDDRYNNCRVSEILKNENITNKDEIVQEVFEILKGNKLLIITFYAQKKVDEKGFLEDLEKNYGVYLEVDDFIEEMKKKLEEIKTYKQLLEFVGCDIGKDKTDMELIIEAYDKAKEKKYIKEPNAHRNENDSIRSSFRSLPGRDFRRGANNGFRGRSHRGEFRGRGRGRDRGFRGRDRGFRGRDRGFRGRDRGRGRGRGRGNYRGRRNLNPSNIRLRSRSRSRSSSR